MTPRLVIRRAERGDLPAVLGLWRQLMAHQEGPEPRFRRSADGEQRFLETASSHLERADARFLVATAGGRVVGYIVGRLVDNHYWLNLPQAPSAWVLQPYVKNVWYKTNAYSDSEWLRFAWLDK